MFICLVVCFFVSLMFLFLSFEGVQKCCKLDARLLCVTSLATEIFSSCTKSWIGFFFVQRISWNCTSKKLMTLVFQLVLRHISSQKLFRLQLTFFWWERDVAWQMQRNVCSNLLVCKKVFVHWRSFESTALYIDVLTFSGWKGIETKAKVRVQEFYRQSGGNNPRTSGVWCSLQGPRVSTKLMPHSHQGFDTFKRRLVKHSSKMFPS